ncbi:MAG: 2'-5' RNA ligase family protein, partial [Candidatus Latescibacterota bacterium]|nr:2'-5' RNA ligase family protein [Candidatus Latescibacterota bacterium]
RRPFRPHLTIGRLRQTTRSQDTSWVDTEVPEISYSVNTVSLIESQLAPRGAIYQTLYQAQLE